MVVVDEIDDDVEVDEALEHVRKRGELATASCILLNMSDMSWWC